MSQTVYITKGLPASGKSQAVNNMAKLNPNLRLVSKDDLRRTLFGSTKWNPKKEPLVIEMENLIIRELLVQGYDVAVHNTHLAGNHIERISEIAERFNAEPVILDFTNILIEECIKRDALRENAVGYRVILGMAEKYLNDQYNQFRLRYPTNNDVLEMLLLERIVEIDNDKNDCIIVDIDGTLAIMGDRSPYDFTKVIEDSLYTPLAHILRILSREYTIIYLSGRDVSCYNETQAWLEMNGLWFYDTSLFMREDGDNRDDAIVKEELWREQVDVFYNVICVFDDRKRVVDMWRKNGLFCCQVNWGDF